MLFYVYLDITCPVPYQASNATQNTTAATYATYLKYTCNYGHWFPDQSFSKVTVCQDNGSWTVSIGYDCQGSKLSDLIHVIGFC